MKELTNIALDTATQHGVSYADIRIIHTENEAVYAKNEKPSRIDRSDDLGFGVRVIANGAWGFASSNEVSKSEVEKIAALAVEIAKASATTAMETVWLAPEEPHQDIWRTSFQIDPFKVGIEKKLDLLLKINAELMKVKQIKIANSQMDFTREQQFFANTEGSFIEQTLMFSEVGYSATAVDNEDMQRRSFPSSFGGQGMTKGYELIEELPLLENTKRIAEEAAMLLTAKQCPQKTTDLILEGSQLALQIHESIGHPTELDRVLGTEANYAGTSFATIDKLGKLQYGSPIVNIVADSTVLHGLATVGYDDEGVAAQKWHIIKEGILVGYLTSRETVHAINGNRSHGAMRADGWRNIPLIRMTNMSLMPGDWTLEELIADTNDGIYMETNKSWSIDQQRVNFQFATEIAWEIKNGKKIQPLKNPSYQGITVEFWNSCDAICNENYFVLWGLSNCGKGQPGQTAQMSHGAAPARFRNVKVGVANV
jgi:TldD protein